MRTYRKCLIVILILVFGVGSLMNIKELNGEVEKREVTTQELSDEMVIPGGMPIGIYMETDGVLVLGTEAIQCMDGLSYEPAEYVVKEGDYIIAFNGQTISAKAELIDAVDDLTEDKVILTIRRNEENLNVKIEPVQVKQGEYKLGIWVRDNVQGLGTLTYLTTNSEFGALGHGIHDVDTNDLIDISEGAVYKTSIRNVQKGTAGNPGGLEGVIIYNNYNVLGEIEKNTEEGIYGTIEKIEELFDKQDAVEVCKKEEIKTGDAVIRCTIDETVEEYDVEIVRVELYNRDVNKGIVLKITDPELLKVTGGIVQGMSGSPILQDGKIIGAVTHVFVNDPTSGYGIFIEEMLEM